MITATLIFSSPPFLSSLLAVFSNGWMQSKKIKKKLGTSCNFHSGSIADRCTKFYKPTFFPIDPSEEKEPVDFEFEFNGRFDRR